jgi:hypothetical protein
LNNVLGTSSKSAHFWDPKMFTTVREGRYKLGSYTALKRIHVFLENPQIGNTVINMVKI